MIFDLYILKTSLFLFKIQFDKQEFLIKGSTRRPSSGLPTSWSTATSLFTMIENYFRRDDVHLEKVRGNMLRVGCDFIVAHCISCDCALDKGIARDMDLAFGVPSLGLASTTAKAMWALSRCQS